MEPRVIQADFFRTGTYENQYIRNFQTHRNTDQLTENFLRATDNGSRITAASTARIVGDIMGLKSEVRKDRDLISIENGWDTERFSFIIVVLMEDNNGATKRCVLTGFTDHGEFSLSNHLDDRMVLYINNCYTVRDHTVMTTRGTGRRSRILDNEYILRGKKPTAIDLLGNRDFDTMLRPCDVFFQKAGADNINALGGADTYTDNRAYITGDFKLARRVHNNPANYLSDTIKAGIVSETRTRNERGMRDLDEDRRGYRDIGINDEEISSAESAAALLSPSEINRNDLFCALISRTDFETNAEVTLGELSDAVDWPNGITKVINTGRVERARNNRHYRGEGSEWHGTNNATMAAEFAAKIIPSVMMANSISSGIVTLSNDTRDGSVVCRLVNATPMIQGIDILSGELVVEETLKFDLANMISRNGDLTFSLSVDINIALDMQINIQINDEPEEDFCAPIYCDGLTSPMKSNDSQVLQDICNDIDDLVTASLDSSSVRANRKPRSIDLI